jgi:capsular exopolysaccharide synthesis family protein
MFNVGLPLVALVAACGVALAFAWTLLQPRKYAATASVLLPAGSALPNGNGSRVLRLDYVSTDRRQAAEAIDGLLRGQTEKKALVIDEPKVLPLQPQLGLNLALGGMAGLLLGIGLVVAKQWRRRPVRTERDLVDALGTPILAARPLQRESIRELCSQLLEHWITPQRRLLPVVSAGTGEGRTYLAAQIAMSFAQMGEKTLLVDADLRAPALHRLFNFNNHAGLADFLAGGSPKPVPAMDNLAVIVAGAVRSDPLELLARERLRGLLAEAARHFRVIVVDTPAASRGPDFEMFAALAGGALVVTRSPGADSGALERLHAALARCSARVVGTILNPT